jgi:putative transposase
MDIQNRITGEVYFVTDTVVDWVDIFSRPRYKILYLNRYSIARHRKDF